jgi:hypothetical protein
MANLAAGEARVAGQRLVSQSLHRCFLTDGPEVNKNP